MRHRGKRKLAPSASDIQWWFCAQITTRAGGENGVIWANSFLENVENLAGFNKMAGLGQVNLDLTAADLNFELTALIAAGGADAVFALDQCSIEFLDV